MHLPAKSLGKQQAQALGDHFGAQIREVARSGRVSLHCSSMARAMQTVHPLAEALALEVQVLPDVVEIYGFFQKEGGQMAPKVRAELLPSSAPM